MLDEEQSTPDVAAAVGVAIALVVGGIIWTAVILAWQYARGS